MDYPDIPQHVTPGQKQIRPEHWDSLVDGYRRGDSGHGSFVDGGGVARRAASLAKYEPFVWIKNETGATVNRFGIMGLNTGLCVEPDEDDDAKTAAFKRRPIFRGIKPRWPNSNYPTTADKDRFVVALEKIPNLGIGKARVTGVVHAQVEVASGLEWYDYADVTDNNCTKLTLLPSGAARVLWREAGTGTKWAIVSLGNHPGDVTYMGRTLDILPVTGAEATCYIYLDWDDYYYYQSVSETVEAGVSQSLGSVSLAANKAVTLTWLRRYRRWVAAGAC